MSNRPLYAELAAELIRNIRCGKYPVGSLLPTEIELSRQRNISRATARSALSHLANLGLVSRHKGIGTRVEMAEVSSDYNASTTTLADLAHYGAATTREIRSVERVVADEELARLLDGKPGRRWIKISAVRSDPMRKERPICWTDNYLDVGYEDIAGTLQGATRLIADLISERFGVSIEEVRQTISAILIPSDIAQALSTEAEGPALQITRRYRSAQAIEMISISIHPADRFEYELILRRPRNGASQI